MRVHFISGRLVLESCVAALTLVLLFPILLATAIAVFLEGGLPILFQQTRVGRNGQVFRILKIRTMRPGARGNAITIAGDQRVTRLGRVLRKFKLDELPQLWNVVKGEMSLVGPRPEVPEFVDLSDPEWRSVLRVRPGITDPVSVAYRDEEKLLGAAKDGVRFYREVVLPNKLRLTLGYLENRSFWGDVLIIAQTIRCAVFPGQFETKRAGIVNPET